MGLTRFFSQAGTRIVNFFKPADPWPAALDFPMQDRPVSSNHIKDRLYIRQEPSGLVSVSTTHVLLKTTSRHLGAPIYFECELPGKNLVRTASADDALKFLDKEFAKEKITSEQRKNYESWKLRAFPDPQPTLKPFLH